MGAGPLANDGETGNERLAGTADVKVLHVHYLKPGLGHDSLRVKLRIFCQTRRCDCLQACRMSIAAALAIGKDVQLYLPYP